MKKLFILISALSTLAACQREVPQGDLAPVQIRIATGSSLGGAKTRADAFEDYAITRVDVLVFDNSDPATLDNHLDAELVEVRYAYKKSGTNDLYSATLKAGEGLDVYFAINAEDIITDANLAIGATWGTVQESLILTNADIDRPNKGLPMWGYRYGETINQNAAGNNFGTVYISRAVATADVEITATNFTLLEGSVQYITDKGYLGYLVDAANFRVGDGVTEVLNVDKPQLHYWLTSPQIPATATTGTSPNDYFVAYELATDGTDNNSIKKQLYFFENDGPDSETTPTNGRKYSKVVLKGMWDQGTPEDTSDDIVSYYPLAFRDRDENAQIINERVDIIRNRQFKFSISNVNGNGYPTLEEAKQGGDLNMKYEVIPWDEWDDSNLVVGSDSRWVSISPSRNKTEIKRASLYRNATSTDEIGFTTNYDPNEFELALSESGVVVALDPATDPAGTIAKVANDFYEIALILESETTVDGETEYKGRFIFTALEDYAPTNPESTLTVSNAYVEFLLKVDQENSSPEDWVDGGDKNVVLGQ